MPIGLRIDVDTWRGTRDGVPALLRTLEKHGIRGTWYFTVGPDNMGRHIRRMLRPTFALKMLRSRAASLYGWDIVLRGTLWPGPLIGVGLADTIRLPIRAGHEFGVHAWDHHRWQVRAGSDDESLLVDLDRATACLADIAGTAPQSTASAGWRCTERLLLGKCDRPFRFHSDVRGPALPVWLTARGSRCAVPNIPVDLPTYDEAVGRNGVTDGSFNQWLLSRMSDGAPHVLTIHAESEGGAKAALFDEFLSQARAAGHEFVPLGEYLDRVGTHREAPLGRGIVTGREDWVATIA